MKKTITQTRLDEIRTKIVNIKQQFEELPAHQKNTVKFFIKESDDWIKKIPSAGRPVYVHIIGLDKSFKTSYVIDLIGNEDLREWFDVKSHTTTEHTAVSCLIRPSDKVTKIVARQIFFNNERSPIKLTLETFKSLYDFEEGAKPGEYMLEIFIPKDNSKIKIPIIEHPGMKKGADESDKQKKIHEQIRKNMLRALQRFPGIFVACFRDKVNIPQGHPIDTILQQYSKFLSTPEHKLPLILSLQGESAITSYCGNTNVLGDIKKDFKSYESFNTTVQLVNPSHKGQRPVNFGEKGKYVDEWIKELSKYESINNIYEYIKNNNGINYSRNLLGTICNNSHIRETIDNIYLAPIIEKCEEFYNSMSVKYEEIRTIDIVKDTREKLRKILLDGEYKTLRSCFEEKCNKNGSKEFSDLQTLQAFWTDVLNDYLRQLVEKENICKIIANTTWKSLYEMLDPKKQGFSITGYNDAIYIILNVAECYVPNAILRGDSLIYKGIK